MSLITGGGSSFSMPLGNFYVRRQEVNQDECNKSCFEDFKKESECTTGTDDEKKLCACKKPGLSSDKFKNCASSGTHKVCNVDETGKAGLEALKFYWNECQPLLKELGEEVEKTFKEVGGELKEGLGKLGDNVEEFGTKAADKAEDGINKIGEKLGIKSAAPPAGVMGVKKLVVVGLLAWGVMALV